MLGISHLRPCATLSDTDSRPSLSDVIITKKIRDHGENLAQPFPPLASLQQRQAILG